VVVPVGGGVPSNVGVSVGVAVGGATVGVLSGSATTPAMMSAAEISSSSLKSTS
jgi:hypothetical protein